MNSALGNSDTNGAEVDDPRKEETSKPDRNNFRDHLGTIKKRRDGLV